PRPRGLKAVKAVPAVRRSAEVAAFRASLERGARLRSGAGRRARPFHLACGRWRHACLKTWGIDPRLGESSWGWVMTGTWAGRGIACLVTMGLMAGCARPPGPSGSVRTGQTGKYVTFEPARPQQAYEVPPMERP